MYTCNPSGCFPGLLAGIRECLTRTLVQNTRIGELDGPDDLGRKEGSIFTILHEVGR